MSAYPNDYLSRAALLEYANNSTDGIDANDIARFPGAEIGLRYGEWIVDLQGGEPWYKCTKCTEDRPPKPLFRFRCSRCGEVLRMPAKELFRYCPCCGARMKLYEGRD